MEFTEKETLLCEKVAEKHKKEVKVGDWLQREDGLYLVVDIVKTPEKVDLYATDFGVVISADDDFFPLWQISDCLEFIREKSFYGGLLDRGNRYAATYTKPIAGKKGEDLSVRVNSGVSNTPLEACLKVVLAIVEEK